MITISAGQYDQPSSTTCPSIIETTRRRFLPQAVVIHVYHGKDSDIGVARHQLDQQYSEENSTCCNETMLQEGQRFQECCRRRQAGTLSRPPEQC